MTEKLLQEKNVQIVDGVSDWTEAIEVCTKPLLDQGFVTSKYPETIIELTKKHGAYYVLAPNVALIHARPENGVIKKQLSATLLRRPVYFPGKKYPTKLLITLAAEDTESHLDAICEIGNLLSDDEKLRQMLEAKDSGELYRILISGQNDGGTE